MELRCISGRETRLLSILRQELGMSSTLVKRLKYQERYFVNGQSVHTDFPVRPGDLVCVVLDEAEPVYPMEAGELHILYEDEALIALDKPAGMLVHPSSARNTGTLANRLIHYYHETGQPCAVHPVSRLDRDTFGIVLLAKNAHAHARMMACSRAGMLEKTYEALTLGAPDADEGVWEAPIARAAPPSLLRCVRPDGKSARTAWQVLQRGEISRLCLRPLTGRTHQLRLHCAHFGCPILGDPQYGTEATQARSQALGLCFQQLQAVRLRFPHPLTGEMLTLHSEHFSLPQR